MRMIVTHLYNSLRKHMGEVQGWRAPEQSDKWAEAEKHFRKVGHGEADRT